MNRKKFTSSKYDKRPFCFLKKDWDRAFKSSKLVKEKKCITPVPGKNTSVRGKRCCSEFQNTFQRVNQR